MACLIYLPPITNESESVRLLEEAYPALIRLAHVRHPENRNGALKQKALDLVMRDGIVKGYAQAGEHVKIAESLIKQMDKLVDEMGIDSVKHLKVITSLNST